MTIEKKFQLNKRIWIPISDGYQAIEIDDIIFLEADRRYTYIHLRHAKKLLSSKNLKEYLNILEDFKQFILIHRSYFINSAYIQKYVTTDGGFILMKDNAKIPIARRRKQEILDLLNIR